MPWNEATRPHYNRDQLRYPSDLTQEEFATLSPYLPAQDNPRGRPRQVDLHDILNALSYWLRSGCQWRMLPKDFPPWKTVYSYYWRWCQTGLWQQLHETLYPQARLNEGRNPCPTAAILDSQSVKTCESGGPSGFDAAKKVKGRKRHILVDVLGFIVAAIVHTAEVQDRQGGVQVLETAYRCFASLLLIWADAGYSGPVFAKAFAAIASWTLEIVSKPKSSTFVVLPKRWIVERTFAWMGRNRRLSKDYERNIDHSQANLFLAMSLLMTRRLARS